MSVQVLKGVAVLAMSAAFFIAGYQYAAALYGEDIAALREDYATRAQSLEVKYREKERGYAQSLVDAWEARDEALARVDDLGADLERVRKQSDAARRRLSAAGSDTCKSERKRLERGAELVERGSGLLERCVQLAERTSIDKDAITKIVAPAP